MQVILFFSIVSLLLNFILYSQLRKFRHLDNDDLTNRAKTWIAFYAKEDAAGEYKRHQVYAQLIKEFPEIAKKDIAFVIERVLQSTR